MNPSKYNLSDIKHIYFMGIGGTGMAAMAGLCLENQFKVSGSDNPLYPPMSTLLEDLGITVISPFDPKNLQNQAPDLVVVANVLSQGHPEVEALKKSSIPYTSFPELMGRLLLKNRHPIVVTGTHGKTTTTTLMAYLLDALGEDPGFFIGGVPRNFARGFRTGKGKCFVIEGDEYDTAYFDKGPKFLHYQAQTLVINAIEFDHADIYKDLQQIEGQFAKLLSQMHSSHFQVIANIDDPQIKKLVLNQNIAFRLITTSPYLGAEDADLYIKSSELNSSGTATRLEVGGKLGIQHEFEVPLFGPHNLANLLQCLATLQGLREKGVIAAFTWDQVAHALGRFQGVKRRFDLLAHINGIFVYEDFAHHPTAVQLTIKTLQQKHPGHRIIVAYEPKNATGRRNVFEQQYAEVFGLADRVLIGECPLDTRIPEGERMNTQKLASLSGSHVEAFHSNEELLDRLRQECKKGDVVAFMSSSSFSGCQHRFSSELNQKYSTCV